MTSSTRGTSRLLAFAALALAGAPSLAQDLDDIALVGESIAADLAREAAAVLELRCVSCHNPDAEDRKAVRSWPDALDVQAMLDDGIIEPDDAALSYVLELIDDGEMPPSDSGVEPVTEAERATLLAWIEAGAPAFPARAEGPVEDPAQPDREPARDPAQDPVQDPAPGANGETAAEQEDAAPAFAWTDLGVLHPLLVHFPVALLLAVVLAELLVACGARGLRTASRFCAWLGVLGGLAAGATGWLLAENTVDRMLETHRWLGVASVVSALLLALSLEGRSRGGGSRSLHIALVVATAVLVSLSAHWGGAMTWGTDHFSDLTFLPAFLR